MKVRNSGNIVLLTQMCECLCKVDSWARREIRVTSVSFQIEFPRKLPHREIFLSSERESDLCKMNHESAKYFFRLYSAWQICRPFQPGIGRTPARKALAKHSSGRRRCMGQQHHLVILLFKYKLFS